MNQQMQRLLNFFSFYFQKQVSNLAVSLGCWWFAACAKTGV